MSPRFNPRFRSIYDTHDIGKALYDRETIVWLALKGMPLRRASRKRMDCDRNEGRFAESVSKGCCGPLWALHLESLFASAGVAVLRLQAGGKIGTIPKN